MQPQNRDASSCIPAAHQQRLLSAVRAALLVNVDVDPWLGMQAAGGISSGQNVLGKALMVLRAQLREAQ